MNNFRKRTAIRIAAVSLLLASFASPVAWYVARENAEDSFVSFGMEETKRLLHNRDIMDQMGVAHPDIAARILSGGLFDIAEIYDVNGAKQAESVTDDGEAVEPLLPRHHAPAYDQPWYESLKLPQGEWVMRVFVPLREDLGASSGKITGYFEGVRVVPAWQKEQIVGDSLLIALMVGLASLLCGGAIYPVVVYLSSENERKSREVLDSHISMMEALGRAIAKRDSDTGAHNYRVAWMSAQVAERMGLSGTDMQALIAGSFLHDVGKIGIPDAILLKPGRLDADELTIMRTHVAQGEEIVTGMGWLDGANAVVAAHHEKWNGTGYPRGLAGENIPLSARIFAVADVFDALSSKRPYKQPMPFDTVMDILDKDTGSHFDPAVMAVFRTMARGFFDLLGQSSEDEARCLLEECVRRHFSM